MRVDAEDGRVCLPEELRERYGDRYELVEDGDRLVLTPVTEDPLTALREEFTGVDGSPTDLAANALDEATDRAGQSTPPPDSLGAKPVGA